MMKGHPMRACRDIPEEHSTYVVWFFGHIYGSECKGNLRTYHGYIVSNYELRSTLFIDRVREYSVINTN